MCLSSGNIWLHAWLEGTLIFSALSWPCWECLKGLACRCGSLSPQMCSLQCEGNCLWGEIKFHLRLGLACYFSDTFSSSATGPLWAVAPGGFRYLYEVSSPRSSVRGPTCSLLNLQTIETKPNIYLYNEWALVTSSKSGFIKGILKAYSQNEETEKSRRLTTTTAATTTIRNPGGNLGGS